VDRDGKTAQQCGCLKDTQAAFKAMMEMKKMDIATLQKAYDEG